MQDPEFDHSPLPMPEGTGVPFQPGAEPELDELLCLHGNGQGPCKHLWQYETNFEAFNTESYRENVCVCLRIDEGVDMKGRAIYSCNQFVPLKKKRWRR